MKWSSIPGKWWWYSVTLGFAADAALGFVFKSIAVPYVSPRILGDSLVTRKFLLRLLENAYIHDWIPEMQILWCC
jgi:hypothetical protein